MRVSDIVALLPEAALLLATYGLHCSGCNQNQYETLEEGCQSHGFSDEEIDMLVRDLNTSLRDLPRRPQTLTITAEARAAIAPLLPADQTAYGGFLVLMDEQGFCMEYAKTAPDGTKTFFAQGKAVMRFFASKETLSRIGGATIDHREGRFKLDLPSPEQGAACPCKGGRCTCGDKQKV